MDSFEYCTSSGENQTPVSTPPKSSSVVLLTKERKDGHDLLTFRLVSDSLSQRSVGYRQLYALQQYRWRVS